MELEEKYGSDPAFKEYVDRYAKQYIEGKSISVSEALTHEMVKNYAKWLDTK